MYVSIVYMFWWTCTKNALVIVVILLKNEFYGLFCKFLKYLMIEDKHIKHNKLLSNSFKGSVQLSLIHIIDLIILLRVQVHYTRQNKYLFLGFGLYVCTWLFDGFVTDGLFSFNESHQQTYFFHLNYTISNHFSKLLVKLFVC